MYGFWDCCCGPVEVFFLTDCTGSMNSHLPGLKACYQFLRIFHQLDCKFGVAKYTDSGSGPAILSNLTYDTNQVGAAIDSMASGGGGDHPEDWLRALHHLATNWTELGGTINSEKIIIIAGDAPSHNTPISFNQCVAALNAANINIIWLNMRPFANGLDEDEFEGITALVNELDHQGQGEIFGCHFFNEPEQDCDCGIAEFWLFVFIFTDL